MRDSKDLLTQTESVLAHIWNIIINGGKFTDDDLKEMEELGMDIRYYLHKTIEKTS